MLVNVGHYWGLKVNNQHFQTAPIRRWVCERTVFFRMQALLFFSTPLPLFPCFRSRSHFLDGLSRKCLLRKLTFPTAPSIRLQFRFEIWEILRVQWNGTFRSHRPDPGDRSFDSRHIFCNFSFLLACIKSLTMNNTISLN